MGARERTLGLQWAERAHRERVRKQVFAGLSEAHDVTQPSISKSYSSPNFRRMQKLPTPGITEAKDALEAFTKLAKDPVAVKDLAQMYMPKKIDHGPEFGVRRQKQDDLKKQAMTVRSAQKEAE